MWWLLVTITHAILEDGVLVLKASNFENHVAEHYKSGLMVYFYAPWCAACQQFTSEYVRAAELLPAVQFAKIDAPEIAAKYSIEAFPALRWLKEGRAAQLAVSDAEQLVAAAERLRRERCRALESFEQVEREPGVRVVGFFKSRKTKEAKKYLRAVDEFRYPIDFYIATDDLRESANMTKGRFLMLKPYDELRTVYSGKDLARWLEKEMMPLVVPFLPQYIDMIFGGPLPVHCILAVHKIDDAVRDVFYEAARRNKGKILHILMFAPEEEEEEDDDMRSVWDFLNIRETPTIIMSDMTTATEENPQGTQVHFDGDPTSLDALLAFQLPYEAKARATRAGLDPKMAEIMAEPKLRQMLQDDNMKRMFQLMGMPKQLADIYDDEL